MDKCPVEHCHDCEHYLEMFMRIDDKPRPIYYVCSCALNHFKETKKVIY